MTTDSTLAQLRRGLLLMLLVSLLGTGTELLLLGHLEGPAQVVPLALIALSVVVAVWHLTAASPVSLATFRTVMVLLVLSGALGVALHTRGNLEFARELYPDLTGYAFLAKVVSGATPVLAPGTMTLLGGIGLLQAFRHPAGHRAGLP